MSKHVVVLMGGLSSEKEVSVSSGNNVCKALDNLGYKYTILNPTQNVANEISILKPDVVFNALHGTFGEDGSIPGILESLRIPYTHSGILASSIGFNKEMTKNILSFHGVRMPKSIIAHIKDAVTKDLMPRPYVIKPLQQGSTVGVYIVHPETKLDIDPKTWAYGDMVMVEQFIPGLELSTAVLGNKSLGTLEIIPKGGFNDYAAKYTPGLSEHVFPAQIPQEALDECDKFAETAHNVLGCRSISRSDFRYDAKGDGKVYFLEINTHPGLTNTSIVPDILKGKKMTMEQLVDKLINEAKVEINP